MGKQKIRVIKKNDEFSMEYEVGDILEVEGTWYGGVNAVGKSGIPLSLDREEYEEYKEGQERKIDSFSYQLGVMDCFCEMVAAGLKRLAMSHPCETKEERDSYLEEVKKLCQQYEISFYAEDDPLLTPLFPESLNKGKYNYLFFRTQDVLEEYLQLKACQKEALEKGIYTEQKAKETAVCFGKLLSYPEDGIARLLQKTAGKRIE